MSQRITTTPEKLLENGVKGEADHEQSGRGREKGVGMGVYVAKWRICRELRHADPDGAG